MRRAVLAALACWLRRAASQQAPAVVSLSAGVAAAAQVTSPAWQQFSAASAPQLEVSGEFAGQLRVASGPLPGTDATCAFGAAPIFGRSLPSGGERTRVSVYGTGPAFGPGGGAASRRFYLALPVRYAEKPRPLLLALHGGFAFAQTFLDATQLDVRGSAHGYVVAAPDGLPVNGGLFGGTWAIHNHAGDGGGDVHPDADDAAFIAIVAKCIAALQVPLSKQLLLAGYSLGAKFACRFACAPPPGLRVVAVALAAGIQAEPGLACSGPAVPTLLFQGGADPQVPFCRRGPLGELSYEPTASHFAALAARNGAAGAPAEQLCAALGDAVVYSYRPQPAGNASAPGASTALFWLPGGGHVWPQRTLPGCVGDATEVALAFFAAQLRGGAAAQQGPLPRAVCAALAPCPQRAGPCERGSRGGDGTTTITFL